jgi:hypothetical protein
VSVLSRVSDAGRDHRNGPDEVEDGLFVPTSATVGFFGAAAYWP